MSEALELLPRGGRHWFVAATSFAYFGSLVGKRIRNEARFRELIESAPEPIGIIRAGHFVYANRAYVTVLGFADEQSLYATPLDSLLDADGAMTRASREAQVLERAVRPAAQTYRVRRRDGSVVMLEVSSVYFEYEGKPSVLNIARDLTRRGRPDKQPPEATPAEGLEPLGAGVTHEINNPLAYVMLNLEWILQRLPNAVHDPANIDLLVNMLDEARHEAQRVSTILKEVRSFSRVEAEMRRPVDLVQIVESALKITGHEIRRRARVSKALAPVGPVWGNEARLEQVVIHLLTNAAQAMPVERAEAGEIRVSIHDDGEGHAVLEVTDNGEGIPRDIQPRIFDPFFTTRPASEGTGLGLCISQGIVTSLGGQIVVCSEAGAGATFRVVLPTTDSALEHGRSS